MAKLVFTIHEDGSLEIEGQGFVDPEDLAPAQKKCRQASLGFEKALGLENVTREEKQQESRGVKNHARNSNTLSR